MQEIKDMKEVAKGIFEPTEECFILDEDSWYAANRGYGFVCNKDRKVLYVYALNTPNDIVAYVRNNVNVSVQYHSGHYDISDVIGGLF